MYWASQVILSFQVLIVFLMMTALWMMTTTFSWVMALISRSVQINSTISYETPIYIILYVLRDVRTLFMYYFLGIRYILLYCFDDTLLRSFFGAYVRIIILFYGTYFIGFYV